MNNNKAGKKRNIVKCSICQKTEDDLLELKKIFARNINKELSEIEEKKQFYKNSHGFTYERLAYLRKLNRKILNMNIDIFVEQKQELLTKIPELKFLYNFIQKIRKPNANKEKILPFKKTVKDIVQLYISQSENHPHVLEHEMRKTVLLDIKKQIRHINVEIKSFARDGILLNIMERQKLISLSEDEKFSFFRHGGFGYEDNDEDIKICIFCFEIMNGAFFDYKSKLDSYFERMDIVI